MILEERGQALSEGLREAYLQGAKDQHKVDTDRACEAFRRFLVFIERKEWKVSIDEIVNDFRNILEKDI